MSAEIQNITIVAYPATIKCCSNNIIISNSVYTGYFLPMTTIITDATHLTAFCRARFAYYLFFTLEYLRAFILCIVAIIIYHSVAAICRNIVPVRRIIYLFFF